MRAFVFSTKVAAWFALVLGVVLVSTLWLLMYVVGHHLVEELGRLRAYEGVDVAEQIEAFGLASPAEDPRIRALVEEEADRRGVSMALGASSPGAAGELENLHRWFVHRHSQLIRVRGRTCRVVGAPDFETWTPIFRDGRQVARLVVGGSPRGFAARAALHSGLLQIGLLALVGTIAISVYLTRPLRRMSRSMDRIAAGDLDHRVSSRGRDEVAAMGRSFNAMADRIQEMLLGQKELMAGVSHELRSPLARMKVALELLRREGVEERLEDLEGEVDEIDGLVGELLLASRFDLGSVPVEAEVLDLRQLIAEAWERLAAKAEGGSTLRISLAEGGRQVSADRALTLRIFANLFENCLRYAGPGEVSVASVRADDRVGLTVADRGPGVEDSHFGRLFEPFYRADPSRSRSTGAAGLGLMIVRRAVEAHGGSVRAEAAPGGGLAIAFDLPASPEAE